MHPQRTLIEAAEQIAMNEGWWDSIKSALGFKSDLQKRMDKRKRFKKEVRSGTFERGPGPSEFHSMFANPSPPSVKPMGNTRYGKY
tara:strand:- start:222 stop:479 length:258 start_codon:yes stop_codon:yes gene_type:complete